MKQQAIILMIALFASRFGSSPVFAQHSHKGHSVDNQTTKTPEELPTGLSDMKSQDHHHMEMDSSKQDQKMNDMNDHNMKMESSKADDSIIRKGEIDLKAIDKNKDGKVYQDQMDWNVISDELDKCPKCNMILKEVTLEKAKENLIKHDFKVKE